MDPFPDKKPAPAGFFLGGRQAGIRRKPGSKGAELWILTPCAG